MKVTITHLRGNIYNIIKRIKRTGDVEITYKGKVVAKIVEVTNEHTDV